VTRLLALALALAAAAVAAAAVAAQGPAPAPPPAAQDRLPVHWDPLPWAPPALDAPATVTITNANRDVTLDKARDYVLRCAERITHPNGVVVNGGNDYTLAACLIEPAYSSATGGSVGRGLHLRDYTGTAHVEGLAIGGPYLREGINHDSRNSGSTLQLQAVRVGPTYGDPSQWHSDVFQTWGGPSRLRIARLTGETTYQGFMFQPTAGGGSGNGLPIQSADLRDINIRAVSGTGYGVYMANPLFPIATENVFLAMRRATGDFAYPRSNWYPVRDPTIWAEGDAPYDFAPAGGAGAGVPGEGYVAPGR
jgi:hypothetical protein